MPFMHTSLKIRKPMRYAPWDRITRRSQQIAECPWSGRKVPEYELDQIREVFSGTYRIIYHIKADRMDVIAVIHGATNVLQSEQD